MTSPLIHQYLKYTHSEVYETPEMLLDENKSLTDTATDFAVSSLRSSPELNGPNCSFELEIIEAFQNNSPVQPPLWRCSISPLSQTDDESVYSISPESDSELIDPRTISIFDKMVRHRGCYEAESLMFYGNIDTDRGDLVSAKKNCLMALDSLKQNNLRHEYVETVCHTMLYRIGVSKLNIVPSQETWKNFHMALRVLKEIDKSIVAIPIQNYFKSEVRFYTRDGELEIQKKNIPEARKYFVKARQILIQAGCDEDDQSVKEITLRLSHPLFGLHQNFDKKS